MTDFADRGFGRIDGFCWRLEAGSFEQRKWNDNRY
jgi:hypothetical protein